MNLDDSCLERERSLLQLNSGLVGKLKVVTALVQQIVLVGENDIHDCQGTACVPASRSRKQKCRRFQKRFPRENMIND